MNREILKLKKLKYNLYSNVFYLEFYKNYVYSLLGNIKKKNKLIYFFFKLENNICLTKERCFFFFNYKLKKKINVWYNLFFILSYGYIYKLKLIGLGRKIYFDDNQLILKLGYSHLIYNLLPFFFITKNKIKKRKFISLGGISKSNLSLYCNLLKSYRVPNLYNGNGIFNRDFIYVLKKKKDLIF